MKYALHYAAASPLAALPHWYTYIVTLHTECEYTFKRHAVT